MPVPTRKMTNTEGRRLLNLYVGKHGQQVVANAIGVRQSSVSLWVRGLTRPEPPHRKLLVPIIGGTEDSWLTAKELRFIDRHRAKSESASPTGTEGG